MRFLLGMLLSACFWGAFGGGDYFPALYLADVLGVVTLLLYLFLLGGGRLRRSSLRYVLLPAFLAGAWVILYAAVFNARTGAPLLPSILAQRNAATVLLGPIVYMLYQRGWSLEELERVLVRAAGLVAVTYLLGYLLIDLESWRGSDNPLMKSMVAFDEARGFRLRGPHFLCFFTLIFGVRAALGRGARSLHQRAVLLGAAAASGVVLAGNISRSTLGAAVAGLVIATVFLSRPRRLKGALLFAPVGIALVFIVINSLNGALSGAIDPDDWSFIARADSAAKAWDTFLLYPVLGQGMASYQSISYHDLFGPMFYPGDIGFLGVAFQYGLVGLAAYLAFCLWLLRHMVNTCWQRAQLLGRRDAFAWALLVTCFAMIIASPVQTQFLHDDGMPLGAFAWAWILLFRRWQQEHATDTTEIEGLPAAAL